MALDNFIPQIWAGRLLANLHKAHVYANEAVINRDYEGDIKGHGDVVKINSIGPVTLSDYTKNTDHATPETLTDAQRALLIDQAKMFNFLVDDIDQAQQDPKVMGEAMREAAYAVRNATDQFVAALHTGIGLTSGSDGSPTSIATAASAYDNLVDLGVLLDENDVPMEGRFVIIPPWYEGRMLKDERFVSFGTDANRNALTNGGGAIGSAAGFTVYKSNNVPATSGTKYKVIAGVKAGWSFAEQIVSVEGFRPERRFADAVKGLHVYGAKVVRPNCLVVSTCNKT